MAGPRASQPDLILRLPALHKVLADETRYVATDGWSHNAILALKANCFLCRADCFLRVIIVIGIVVIVITVMIVRVCC